MKPNKNKNILKIHPKKNNSTSSAEDNILKALREKGLSTISDLKKSDMKIIASWAHEVDNDYAAALESLPMKIKSVSELPHSKQDIKIAIKILLLNYLSKGSDDMVALLKDRYARLSAFQEISEDDKETIVRESRELDPINGSGDRSLFPTYSKYVDLIIAEQNALFEDINTFIKDFPNVES